MDVENVVDSGGVDEKNGRSGMVALELTARFVGVGCELQQQGCQPTVRCSHCA
jgi:hypothetical protein